MTLPKCHIIFHGRRGTEIPLRKIKKTLLQYENVLLDGVGSLSLDGVRFYDNSRVGLRKGLIAEEVMGLK